MAPLRSTGQLALPMEELYRQELDRNFELGGRSFYFFDFDDNVMHLPTQIVLFDKKSSEEASVSTTEYASIHAQIGKEDTPWSHLEIRFDPQTGSFRNFRDHADRSPDEQPLLSDMRRALEHPHVDWRGPSWEIFAHAVRNNRPIALITARGQSPNTLKRAINLLVLSRDLHVTPNYVSVIPVSHPDTRVQLGDPEHKLSIAELKKLAIKAAVEEAFSCYGVSPYHRFGMSDDDPHNVKLITEAMAELKRTYPENAFFVFNTHQRQINRDEVTGENSTTSTEEDRRTDDQTFLF